MKETGMEHSSAFARTVLERWSKRENLLPGVALVALTAVAWTYTAHRASGMGGIDSAMGSVGMANVGGLALFLSGWAAMMVAMMLPATLPLILLYRTIARKPQEPVQVNVGMAALLLGYIGVWTAAGLPVYAYNVTAGGAGSITAVLPPLLLVAGGVYQFTAVKRGCHARCSNPLFFLMHKWRPGAAGALRLGVLHGVDCLGCCAGLMVGLVALGMMNVAWMLTAALIIFAEKTLPGGHRIARPSGVLMATGGVAFLVVSALGGTAVM